MKKMHFSINIKAPRSVVWDMMLTQDAYRDWTRLFSPGSAFEGTWEKGSSIHFIGLDEQGESMGGMYSEIAENRVYEHISIKHLGELGADNLPVPGKTWTDAYENYTLADVEGGTSINVDQDMEENYVEYMNAAWPRALARLKIVCEKPESITINAVVKAPLNKVWDCWIKPEHITKWNQADPSWHCPKAENDVKVGGRFCSTLAALDGSASFDFTGTYIQVAERKYIFYIMDDGRSCEVKFEEKGNGVLITSTFQMETENSRELQQGGWQAILDSFKSYTEKLG